MRKKIIGMILAATMSTALLVGCGKGASESTDASAEADTSVDSTAGTNINMAVAFWYELDAHKDYNGWYSSMYGITETLFKVNTSGEMEGWIAESGTNEGNVWTIKLKEGVTFSNGNPVNSDVVIANLQRTSENERATSLASATIEKVDDTTFTITTPEPYPALLDDLADPYSAIMDIDNITDYNNEIIGTGPFTLVSYAVEDHIELAANENYWDGDVALETANVYYIPDASTEAMSLQSGDIDFYINPDVDSVALFSVDSNFTVASSPKTMARYLVFNLERLSDKNVRTAIAQSIDKEAITVVLGGTDTATEGAYATENPYGEVTAPSFDLDAANSCLEAAGYSKNSDGMYEKDGELLTVNVAYYTAKSTDKIATLMQDQLKTAGITAELSVYEDPDSTYMTTGDFDIALYQYSTSAGADSYAFLNATLSSQGNKNAGSFSNTEVDGLIEELKTEADTDKRIELTKEVQQIAIDEVAVDYYAIPNKITCMKSGVSNVGEDTSKDYYMLNKDTTIQ